MPDGRRVAEGYVAPEIASEINCANDPRDLVKHVLSDRERHTIGLLGSPILRLPLLHGVAARVIWKWPPGSLAMRMLWAPATHIPWWVGCLSVWVTTGGGVTCTKGHVSS